MILEAEQGRQPPRGGCGRDGGSGLADPPRVFAPTNQHPTTAQAPALTWLSFGGSRFCDSRNALDTHGHDEEEDDANDTTTPSSPWWRHAPLPVVPLSSLALAQKLGDGASGDVYKAQWGEGGKEAAVKLFRGDTGPDGRAVDELEVLCLVDHPALTKGALCAMLCVCGCV